MPLKQEEQSQLMKDFLGIDPAEVESLDQAKEKFNSTFINRNEAKKDPEIVSAATGKIAGSIERLLEKTYPDFDFNTEELKGKKIEDKIRAVSAFHQSKYSELEEKAKTAGTGDTKAITEKYEGEIKQWQQKHKETEGLLKSLKETHEKTVVEFQEKENRQFIKSQYDEAWKSVPFADTFKNDKLKVNGFTAEFGSKFNLQKQENEVIVTDKEGKRIPSKSKAGEHMSLMEALTEFAKENNVLSSNPSGGRTALPPTPQPGAAAAPAPASSNGTGSPRINPNMDKLKNAFQY